MTSLEKFVAFVRACKNEGVIQAELDGMKFVLSPMALEPAQVFDKEPEPPEPVEAKPDDADTTVRMLLAVEGRG